MPIERLEAGMRRERPGGEAEKSAEGGERRKGGERRGRGRAPNPEVNYIAPWALGEIGDKTAIPPIMQMLTDKNPDMRVLAIDALEKLRAKEALPQLRLLLHDDHRIHFDGLGTVAEAAQAAIAKLEGEP